MAKVLKLCSLICIFFIVIQLSGCIEVTRQQPSTQEDSTPRADQTQESLPSPDPTSPNLSSSNETLSIESTSLAEVGEVLVPSEAWDEYRADNGSLSFYYPKRWNVEVGESAISIDNAKTDEQLLMSMIPFDEGKDPTALATDYITLLQTNNPNLHTSNWRTDSQTADSQVVFDLSDETDGKAYSGLGIVIKDSQQAIWFSYFAPNSAYSYDRGIELLQGFMGTLTSGSESGDLGSIDASDLNTRIDANAKGFIFVLEFALGAPLTGDQEQLILNELKSSWRSLAEEELSNYDQYPLFAKGILTMGQEDLNELREELEKTVMDWIYESPKSDKVVKIIVDQLNTRGTEVIAGDPPLTEMSLTAYSEIIAFSRLLRKDPEATPEQISSDSVSDIKKQVQDSWDDFSSEEQEQIASSPGIWFCLRTLVNNGSESEQDKVRSDLLKLTPETQITKDSNTSTTKNESISMVKHNVMMNIQQMTFNTYMWSRGFNYSPAYGKMW